MGEIRIRTWERKGQNPDRACVRSERRSIAVLPDLSVPVAKAFGNLHPDNPLNRLHDRDRTCLWVLLLFYALLATEERKGKTDDHPLESVSKLMADAAKLAAKLESEVFRGPFSDALRPFSTGFEDLPTRLVGLSKRLGGMLDTFGKRGHKREVFASEWLVVASEFVRLRTGRYNDEHLAELFQGIWKPRPMADFSSDAIRKKRLYAKKQYPAVYAGALKQAVQIFDSSARLDPP